MSQPAINERHRLFVKHYLANGFHAEKAALSAGYAPKHIKKAASQVLNHKDVQKAILEHMEKIEKKIDISIEWVFHKLKTCAELALDESNPNKAEIKNHNALLGALDQINKIQGFYNLKNQQSPDQAATTAVIELPSNNRDQKENKK